MLKIIVYMILSYFTLLLFLYFNQRQLIYFPMQMSITPKEAGVPDMQIVNLHTQDGLTLQAWYRPAMQPHLPTIVYFHGNAGHMGYRGPIIKPFLHEGYGVLLVTYRGYSGNSGTPSEEGFYQDARAALHFLQQQAVPNQQIVLYGESIGGAVAMQMATEYPVGAMILQSPFTSLKAMGQYHYSWLPVRWLLRDSFDSLSKAHLIHIPVLILYSEKDDIVPPAFSRQLYEALPIPKQIQNVSNQGHNDLFDSHFTIQFINSLYLHK